MESKQKSYHESLLRWSTRNVVDKIEGYRYTTHINVFLFYIHIVRPIAVSNGNFLPL